jgi:hypothetical protein
MFIMVYLPHNQHWHHNFHMILHPVMSYLHTTKVWAYKASLTLPNRIEVPVPSQ